MSSGSPFRGAGRLIEDTALDGTAESGCVTESGSRGAGLKRRGVEDLVVTQMLRYYGNQRVPVDEGVVQTALTPMHVGPLDTPEEQDGFLNAILRTGTVFVLNPEDVPALNANLMDTAWDPWDGLPPLPFPRLWIECGHPHTSDPTSFPGTEPGDEWSETGSWTGLYGIGIVGDENGWVAAELYEGSRVFDNVMRYPWDADAGASVEIHRIFPDASSHYPIPELELRDEQLETTGRDPVVDAMAAWRAILVVQMIDILGARHVPVDIPRPHRRAHERRFGVAHPFVYFIDLRQAGDSKPGSGDRQYHHRWMVRGHWRHYDGRRTWVRPYVKGPAGAPWRGRPVYLDRKREKASDSPNS
jgi:hypothetical protein